MDCSVTDDIGGRLRRAREHLGMSLRDAARRTKLSIAVLQAIERNDFASLPGGMFRKAYVRTLAVEVGLNPDEIAADYCARFEPAMEPLAVQDRYPAHRVHWVEQLTPSPRRACVMLTALAAIAAAWFMLAPRPVEPDAPAGDATGEFVATPIARAAMDLTTDSRRDAAPTAMVARTTAVPLRIELTATGPCWVTADTDGDRAMYRLVEPGERLVLEAHRIISLRLGDAGAMTLSINDGPSRSLGRDGEVIKLEVTPDSVKGRRDVAAETGS